MQIHVYDHAQQVGQAAATLLAAQLISKPNSVLGLATGSTPIPTYHKFCRCRCERPTECCRRS